MLKTTFSIYRRWILWGLIGCLLAGVLAGCQWRFRSSQSQASQLVLSSLSDPKTFNAALSKEASEVFGFIGEGLITENGKTGTIEPALAESWKISQDGKQIVFLLKQGLKWSDGQPLTIDDVVFTYNEIVLNKTIPNNFRDGLRVGVEGKLPTVRKLDDRRVEFTVPETFAPFLRQTGIGIMPKHVLEDSIKTKDSQGKPKFLSVWGVNTRPLSNIVVCGPYQIDSYRIGERVILRRNPYYWRHGAKGESQPYIERIAIQVVENSDTDMLQFRSGGIDVTDITSDYFALLKREEKQRGFKIYNGGPSLKTLYLSFNLNQGRDKAGKPFVDPIKSKWFNTVEFRQAIAHATNRRDMLNNIYQGLGDLQHSMIPVQSPYYLSPKDGLKTYEYDVAKAKALLLKAGFKYNASNQLMDAEGNRVRFSMITNAGNKIRESLGAQIKQDLANIGIQVDFNPMAFNTVVDRLSRTKKWDAIILGFQGGGVEPNSSFNIWAVDGGLHGFNQGSLPDEPPTIGWKVAPWEQKINDLYIQGAQELDEKKRKAIYEQAQQIVQENLPFIYMITPLSFSAFRDRIQNVKYSPLGSDLWNIHEIKIAEK